MGDVPLWNGSGPDRSLVSMTDRSRPWRAVTRVLGDSGAAAGRHGVVSRLRDRTFPLVTMSVMRMRSRGSRLRTTARTAL